ncbi:MAG TPA: hypothetical protein VEC19_13295 [Usitatibacter sp.]|nr:hypothetical protein [Usitatibacter sp.]
MTRSLRRFAAALLLSAAFSLPASATSSGVDFTDLWFNPSESGWGVNLIQQYETIFATLFVYGPDNSPRWYVASNLQPFGSNGFTGPLYQTTGPAFSVPWTGTATPTLVGAMTLEFSGLNAGTLTYVVNGTTVTKQVQRQTWSNNQVSGVYLGGFSGTSSSCQDPNSNGSVILFGSATVNHPGVGNTTITLGYENAVGQILTCTFTGPYVQAGRLGSITGTFACSFGAGGPFTLSEIDVTRNGMTARLSGNDGFCNLNGSFGGIRRSF